MAFEDLVVNSIITWLEDRAEHVANVCAGPRSERWFNAEAFVALSHKATIGTFVVYGEQNYSTVLQGTALLAEAADGRKLPDLVGFSGDDIDFVVEAKVILERDSPQRRMASLWKLSEQVQRAKNCCSSCSAIGVIYMISAAGQHVAPEPFYSSVEKDTASALFDANWKWLRTPSGLNGLRLRSTSYGSYPVMHLSVGLAAFVL